VTRASFPRIFLDSNVIVGGIVARWGLDKAVLSICAAKICRLVLADAVQVEVNQNLERIAATLTPEHGSDLLEVYRQFLQLCDLERIPFPDPGAERVSRHLIRHQADVAVLLSAVAARPAWLLTNNTKHFTREVAVKSGLRIATPAEFFRFSIGSAN
jgi:predicted nucleic acid-binding protein